jgi:hypothetical protein
LRQFDVLALGAVADFGAQNCQYTTKVDARKNVQLTTSPAIEPNACCVLPFCFYRLFVNHLVSFFVVRWLGGSFAKLGISLGLCGFANVPPNAFAIFLSYVRF